MSDWPIDIPLVFDWFGVFMLLGVAQGLFISYFFLIKANSGVANFRYLGWLIFGMSLIVLEIFLCYTGLIIKVIHYYDVSEPVNFLYGPLLYLLAASLAGKKVKKQYWHFLPFFLYLLYACLFYVQTGVYKFNAYLWSYHPEIEQLSIDAFIPEDPFGLKDHVNQLAIFQAICYLVPIAIHLKTYYFNAKGRKNWLLAFYGLHFFSLLYWIYKTIFVVRDLQDYVAASLDTLTIYFVSYHTIKEAFTPGQERTGPKYAKSTLPEQLKDKILDKLLAQMEDKKLYLQPQLTLHALAAELKTSTHHLSQVMNERLDKNFRELIAQYRVVEAKRLLSDPSYLHLKLQAIGERSGFNSKSSFNTTFKKNTGHTPSAYRQMIMTKE